MTSTDNTQRPGLVPLNPSTISSMVWIALQEVARRMATIKRENIADDRRDWPGSPHADVDSICLRGPKAWTPEHAFEDDTNWLVPHEGSDSLSVLHHFTVCALVAEMAREHNWNLGRVMLCRLKPGGRIAPHIDEGAYSVAHNRLHFVLQAGRGSLTTVGSQTLNLPPGTVWAFDHQQLHSAHNDDTSPRIHLIVDIRRPGH